LVEIESSLGKVSLTKVRTTKKTTQEREKKNSKKLSNGESRMKSISLLQKYGPNQVGGVREKKQRSGG